MIVMLDLIIFDQMAELTMVEQTINKYIAQALGNKCISFKASWHVLNMDSQCEKMRKNK